MSTEPILLIKGGFATPLDLATKKVKSIETIGPTLVQHQLEHGRPATQDHAHTQELIKKLIKELRTRTPSLTFDQAWTRLQSQRPELFTD